MADVALSARGVHVTLAGRTVLRDVSLTVQRGALLAVLGPNGAGKSTLLRALTGLVAAGGEIAIDGVDLRTLSDEARAQRLSFVPQQSQLRAALPVREVVALGRYARRSEPHGHAEAIDAALRDTDLTDLATRAFSDLSVGEQKRVLLARALCTGAPLLLFDEPTAALDIAHALRLLTLLRTLTRAGRTVVVVLHQLEQALAFADRAILLGAGSPLAEGPVDAVITADRVRQLYEVDMRPGAAPGFSLPRDRAP
jgi:iron complex transport system ATP-binding protein